MRTKIKTLIITALLFQVANIVSAQVKDTIMPQLREPVEVREGKLVYLMTDNRNLENPETKSMELTGRSYEYFYMNFTREYQEKIFYPILRTIFSKERTEQLAGIRLSCDIKYSPVDKKILHFIFIATGQNDNVFPLKLSELDALERKFREEPQLIPPFSSSGKIVERGERLAIPIRFDRLYE